MLLVTETDDGARHTRIGITDFALAPDQTPIVNWPRDLDRPTEHRLDGKLVRAAALPAHNVAGLKEVIADSDNVTIGLSDELRCDGLLHDAVRELRADTPAALADATVLEPTR